MLSFSPSSKVAIVDHFIRLNSLTFIGSKVEKDLQGLIDEMEKIFRVIHAIDMKEVEFLVY